MVCRKLRVLDGRLDAIVSAKIAAVSVVDVIFNHFLAVLKRAPDKRNLTSSQQVGGPTSQTPSQQGSRCRNMKGIDIYEELQRALKRLT